MLARHRYSQQSKKLNLHRATGGKYEFRDWGTFRGGDGMTSAVEAGFSEIFAVWLACCYRVNPLLIG